MNELVINKDTQTATEAQTRSTRIYLDSECWSALVPMSSKVQHSGCQLQKVVRKMSMVNLKQRARSESMQLVYVWEVILENSKNFVEVDITPQWIWCLYCTGRQRWWPTWKSGAAGTVYFQNHPILGGLLQGGPTVQAFEISLWRIQSLDEVRATCLMLEVVNGTMLEDMSKEEGNVYLLPPKGHHDQ